MPNSTIFKVSGYKFGMKTEETPLSANTEMKNQISLESNGFTTSQTGSNCSGDGSKIFKKRPLENVQSVFCGVLVTPSLSKSENYQNLNKSNMDLYLNRNGRNSNNDSVKDKFVLSETELLRKQSGMKADKQNGKNVCYLNRDRISYQLSQNQGNESNKSNQLEKQRFVLGTTGLLPKHGEENINSKQNITNVTKIRSCILSPNFQHSSRKQEKPVKCVRFSDQENQNFKMEPKPKSYGYASDSKSNSKIHYGNLTTKESLPLQNVSSIPDYVPTKPKPTPSHPVLSNKRIYEIVRPQVSSSMYGAHKNAFQVSKGPLLEYRYPGRFSNGKMGTARRNNTLAFKNCRFVWPQQVRYNLLATSANPAIATTRLLTVPASYRASSGATVIGSAEDLNPVSKNLECVDYSTLQSLKNLTSPSTKQDQTPKPFILLVPEPTKKSDVQPLQKENENVRQNNASVQENPTGKTKIQEAQMSLSKISQLLISINRTLTTGFECPGLEPSLPIWKSELEHCILSVQKIKSVLLKHEDEMK